MLKANLLYKKWGQLRLLQYLRILYLWSYFFPGEDNIKMDSKEVG
jgi:hypothetical protein